MKFGLLGTGYWAEHTHAAALAAHPEVDLVGVWGRTAATLTAMTQRLGVRAYQDLDALLADVDAVTIALPPDTQAEVALKAAEAGCHLLLEKPLACTASAADQIVAAVRQRGLATLVFFTDRFCANVDAFLTSATETGRHQRWHGATATMFASNYRPGSPYAQSQWRRERGALWDIGPHVLASTLPVLGPVATVFATTGPRDTHHLLMTHASGAVASMALTLDAPSAMAVRRLVFFGESGIIERPGGDAAPPESFGKAVTALISAVATGDTDHPCNAIFGRSVTEVLLAAEQSLHIGSPVTVESTPITM